MCCSPLGYSLIDEMNRIGMLVDLSHTSDDTARQALKYSKVTPLSSESHDLMSDMNGTF